MTPITSHSTSAPPGLPIAVLVVAMASIQVGAALAKGLFPVVGPIGAVTLRVVLAAVLLCALARPWRVLRSTTALRAVLFYGVALGGMNALFYAALRTVPLGLATAIEFTGPLAVAVFASRRPIDFVWIALALVGLLTLLPLGGTAESVDPVGAALALGAGVCWALYIIVGRRAGAEHGLATTALGMAIAALVVLPFGIATAGATLLTPSLLPLALGVAVLSSAIPYSLEMFALPRLPAKTFGILMSIEPAFGAVAGLALLNEHLTGRQWVAIGTIIVASAGTTLTATMASRPVPQATDPMVGDLLESDAPTEPRVVT